ncbi:hypothetical protein [Frigoriflavimonas asaccharolytica]|uniref:Lipoprotein n=1 Tax=Frigoriflavimonas asaccharolytica TaxID=2735899 RepID=A0A8J8G4N0_9FLAO|nr:hypothetical protein [Frigoriflavimonas asaccharolytica]NRS91378.1 hypothetical protein [Frigoriflavimonas asaccharolytica]
MNQKLKHVASASVFAFFLFIALGSDDDKKTSSTGSKTENQNVVSDTASTSEASTKWQFQEDVDKMTSKTVKYASIDANEVLEFEFPYNGGSIPSLTIRKKDGVNDIYLKVSKGQFNSSYDGGNLRIKFDDEQPKKFSFSGASDNSMDIVFINSTKTIISKLKKSKKIIIEVEFYNEGVRQMEFDVSGFTWE